MSRRAAAAAADAAMSQTIQSTQQYAVSEDEGEEYADQYELDSDDDLDGGGDGDVKPKKGILYGALKPPRHVTMNAKQLHGMSSHFHVSKCSAWCTYYRVITRKCMHIVS